MSEREAIRDRLRKKEAEAQSLEEKLRSARIYIQALHDVLKVLDKDEHDDVDAALKSGSSVALAREAILRSRKPMHINDLLDALGRGNEGRASLTGSISAYVRRGEIFTRPAPNTFGLIELGHGDDTSVDPQPPRGFGRSPSPSDEDIPF